MPRRNTDKKFEWMCRRLSLDEVDTTEGLTRYEGYLADDPKDLDIYLPASFERLPEDGDWEELDAFGSLDQAEFVTGLGFVACQAYLTDTAQRAGIPKSSALSRGPEHTAGHPFVAIVNAAANCWKHRVEWSEVDPRRDQKLTAKLIGSLGIEVRQEYVCSHTLAALLRPLPVRLEGICPFLSSWYEGLKTGD